MARNWSEIPDELVYLIGEKVVRVDDLVRFGAVCKSWRSVSTLKKEHPFAPLIMLAKADNDNLPTIDENDKGIRTFIIPYGGQWQGEQEKMTSFDLEVPKAQGRSCWGSPYGWVVTVGLDLGVHILNPLTGVQIPLPSLTNLHQQANARVLEFPPVTLIGTFTRRFVVGWNPSLKGELIVMAIFGMHSTVAITTCIVPGNGIEATASSSWRLVKTLFGFSGDFIFFNGRIFIIGLEGTLSSCDINQTPLRAIPLVEIADIIDNAHPKSIQVESPPRFYLVEICGHLHLVVRFFERFAGPRRVDFYCQTKWFLVYRFNFQEIKWKHVPDLGEYAMFVGNYASFALSSINYTDFSSNSIYFTDDNYEGYESSYCDTGVFNYKEGTIEKFDFTNHGAFSKFSRPIFFMLHSESSPSFQGHPLGS